MNHVHQKPFELKSFLLYSILPIIGVVGFDQVMKQAALAEGTNVFMNAGVMLGAFEGAPPVARIVSVLVIFGFVLAVGIALQVFFSGKHRATSVVLGLFLGGVVSNAVDRLNHGAVVDHVVLSMFPNLAWNFADFFELIGLVFFITFIWKHKDLFWAENDLRGRHFINKPFQKRFIITLGLFSFFSWLSITLFCFSYFKFIHGVANLGAFVVASLCLLLLFQATSFLLALWWSHKIAGPLHAFERHVNVTLNGGAEAPLKLRSFDELKELEVIAAKIEAAMKRKS